METRSFSFPNGGHSVRKLAVDLEKLGDAKVAMEIEIGFCDEWEMRFTTDTEYPEFRADLLAKKILTMGTRFVCSNEGNLTFRTEWRDLKSYPDTYGVM